MTLIPVGWKKNARWSADSKAIEIESLSVTRSGSFKDGYSKMNSVEENEGKSDEMNNTRVNLVWIGTGELADKLNISDSNINIKLKNGHMNELMSLDKRILEIKKEPGKGRGGFRWRFLWNDDGLKRTLRVGYFSTHISEGAGTVTARRKAISEFAKTSGIELTTIEHDVIGRGEFSLKKLSKLIHHPLVEMIITDQEFSLGGVHCDVVKNIIFAAGIQIVAVPGLYRTTETVQESYMHEITRLLIKLQLLGAPVDDLNADMTRRFGDIRAERSKLHDPGIT
jgi:hypothetical protein